ncbi:hypothetical protein [Haloarchaeobius amylolyticus]|uniref:hypothetical protein n=1 Tax=Haloarchaeobius amylolyticus TaxID=1198296 RepID=UPI00227183FC|nr:hypothetical protein [Haloarchaeobius amylolyticus]
MANKISRRQVLAGLGTIGVASAGAGLGTTAFYSDRESLEGWYEAGRVDLILDYRSTYKPWERYDLQNVPMDLRPAVVADTDGMTYEVAAAPAVRDENGEAISHEDWGAIQTSLDVCALPVPTDLADQRNPDVLGGLSVLNDPDNDYLPGYVDGASAMFVDLDDIKPYDEGETTFSFHLCGNPSFIYAELMDEDADGLPLPRSGEDYRDGVVDPTEPEVAAGDDTAEVGELCDYMYVVVSTDPDCDNLSTPGSDDDILNPFGEEGEAGNVLYAGSMTGWLEQFGPDFSGRVRLPPVVKEDGSGVAGDPDVDAACFEPGVHCYVMNWYLPCKEFDAERLGFTDLPVKGVLVNGEPLSGGEDGMEGVTFNDELRARGYQDEVDGLDVTKDVNVTQTDTCHVGLRFTAEQCRHNTGSDVEVEFTTVPGEGWAKLEENFNSDGSKSAEGHARHGNTPQDQLALRTTGDAVVDGFVGHTYTGDFEPFSFEYDDATGMYTFTVGGDSVSGAIAPAFAGGRIAIQTKADEAEVSVQNVALELDGVAQTLSGPTTVSSSNAGDGRDLDYLLINTTPADLTNGFTVSGEVKVVDNGAPNQESFGFDVVVE